MEKRTSAVWRITVLVSAIAVAIGALLWFISGIKRASLAHSGAAAENLEKALRRGAVACYAAEGAYPPSAEYLTRHYGIEINTDRYAVFYEIFADNLMPEITVVER